jgi:succinate-semialdehyde dehydrogenase/glutarate-semialdehyde dehydrogenase
MSGFVTPSCYRAVNPATEEELSRHPLAGEAEIERALASASEAFRSLKYQPAGDRARLVARIAELLDARSADLARTMALEMGKPLAQGEAEIRKCAWGSRYFAEHAEEFLAAEPRESDGAEAWVAFEPLGPILAIMPWNFPFWQFFRFAAPSLVAGNPVLLKHAPSTPACALAIERLVVDADAPVGAVRNLFLSNEQAARVIGDDRVAGVTLTGSSAAGRAVAQVAGRHVKRSVLELGGSDPFVVLDDADLDRAVPAAVEGRCQNSGQSCIAAKRILVDASIRDEFRERFVDAMRARVVGDPLDRAVDVGPLARQDLRERLERQVRETVAAGAEVLCGGERLPRRGWYYMPTVLARVPPGSPAADEELFGPVATFGTFGSDEEAVRLANASRFGLGASLWTRDTARARRIVPAIRAGAVFVNGLVKSDPRLPFGGIGESGFGRELGREGLLEFVNRKAVWIARPPGG